MRNKNVLVTGGMGYVGTVLVPRLLAEGYAVTVLDLMLYGTDLISSHEKLSLIKGDIRDQETLRKIIPGHDAVIHLACISNDPSFELNPELGKSINLYAFRPLVELSRDSGVQRFIFASSSSVYGIKEERDVHEEMVLEPLTDYSRFKADCESILLKFQASEFTTTTIRPATVCGYSPRQRLDVVVNILTNLAYHRREISVFGGDQLRPNIHIQDMVESYLAILSADPRDVGGKIYNVGYENQPVRVLAETVREVIGSDVRLVVTPTDDDRSYHISSQKIKNELGYSPRYSIRQAVEDLRQAFINGNLPNSLDDEIYFNIRRMQSIKLV